MKLPVSLLRRVLWRRRLAAARAWQEAARREAAEHNEAVRRILAAAPGRRTDAR